jgi:hypothetical protein
MGRTVLIALCIIAVSAETASANERKFTYTYETSVLPPGVREIEVWNTYLTGRNYFYRQLDQRIEYEVGVTSGVMTSLYFNTTSHASDSNGELPGGSMDVSSAFSVSNEWKFKLTDRTADIIGTGLYAELTLGLTGQEYEGKLLFDKQIGRTLLALNVIGEYERESELTNGDEEIVTESTLEFTGGVSQALNRRVNVGVEVRNVNNLTGGVWNSSVLYAGPVASYTGDTWWATLTLMPQLRDVATAAPSPLELTDHERLEARLLLSFHL